MEIFNTIDNFYTHLGSVLRWVTLTLEIITVLFVAIPKTRDVLKAWLRRASGYEALRNDFNENRTEVNEIIDKMRQDIFSINQKLTDHTQLDALKLEGLMNSLKDSLLTSFHYYEERGYITLEELEVLGDVYNSYTALNGNGLIKTRWEQSICKLPFKPPKKDIKKG